MSIQGVNPSVYLSEVSPSDKTWDTQRGLALYIQFLYAQASQFESYANRMHACAGMLEFGFRSNATPQESAIMLKRAMFCRVRFCPVCQWRRSMLWRAKFFAALPAINAACPDAHWLFLTLTVKNCEITDLKNTLQDMTQAWRRLLNRKSFKSAVLGYIRTTEVTLGKDGTAHPHYHAMLLVRKSYFTGKYYITQKAWSFIWQDCLDVDYVPMTHIKKVKGDISKGILETLKYSTKPSDMLTDVEWFLELTQQVHRMRFVATGGVLKHVFKDDDKETDQDLVTVGEKEDNPDDDGRRIIFGFNRVELRYKHLPMRDVNNWDLLPASDQVKRQSKAIRNAKNHPYFTDDLGYQHNRKAFSLVDDFGDLV
jgi:plasmid rolling circle replication initiator protein Rep